MGAMSEFNRGVGGQLAGQVDAAIRDVAQTIVMPLFRNLSKGDIRQKRPGDYVTTADLESERALDAALRQLLPGSVVVAEEAVSADRSVLDRLEGEAPVWVIDPIDGTANYAAGRTPFAIMVGLVERKVLQAGWIYLPVDDTMASAVRGEGALFNGASHTIRPDDDIARMHGIFHIPHQPGRRRDRATRLASLLRSHHRIRCVGADYVDLLTGRTQVALFNRMTPWDHAAGMLIFRESGGTAAKLDGSPYVPVMQEDPVLLAPTQTVWQTLHDRLEA